jgi:hypothetical protein
MAPVQPTDGGICHLLMVGPVWSYGHKMAGPVSSPGLLGRGQQVAVSAVRNPTAGG